MLRDERSCQTAAALPLLLLTGAHTAALSPARTTRAMPRVTAAAAGRSRTNATANAITSTSVVVVVATAGKADGHQLDRHLTRCGASRGVGTTRQQVLHLQREQRCVIALDNQPLNMQCAGSKVQWM